MPIDITQTVTAKTRTGRKVHLISDNGLQPRPLIGIIEGDNEPSSWTIEGRKISESTPSADDIVIIDNIAKRPDNDNDDDDDDDDNDIYQQIEEMRNDINSIRQTLSAQVDILKMLGGTNENMRLLKKLPEMIKKLEEPRPLPSWADVSEDSDIDDYVMDAHDDDDPKCAHRRLLIHLLADIEKFGVDNLGFCDASKWIREIHSNLEVFFQLHPNP